MKTIFILLGLCLALSVNSQEVVPARRLNFRPPGASGGGTPGPIPDVLWYKLNEGSGATANDSSANANTGTLHNSPIWPAGGLIFVGASSQYVSTGKIENLPLVSISAWVKITGAPASPQVIVSFQDILGGATYDKVLLIGTDGKLYFYAYDGATKITSTPASAIPFNTLVHVCVTVDSTTAIAYVNATPVGTVAMGATYAGYSNPNIYIGAPTATGIFGTPTYLDAFVDDVRVYAGPLTPTQVGNLYSFGAQ